MADDLLGDYKQDHPYPNDDFEKLDSNFQEEAVSTTFPEEEAGEDRYGTSQSDESPLLNFDADLTPQDPKVNEPLINFGTLSPEPSAPPATSDYSSGMGDTEFEADSSSFKPEPKVIPEPVATKQQQPADSWLKNVDPRVGEQLTSKEEADYDEKDEVELPPLQSFSAANHGVPTIVEENTIENEIRQLLNLVYWRDVRKTGVVFGSMLFVLLSLAFFSVLSVLAYLSLAVLTVTLSFRVYKNVLQAVQKSGDSHPYRAYLEMDITVPDDKAQLALNNVLKHVNCTTRELRRLFLIEDLVDSLKFGLLLWVLTYIGAWFNGMTLIILCVISIFTLPKVYETYKVQIDNYFNMACSQVDNVMKQVQAKVPFLKKKEKTP